MTGDQLLRRDDLIALLQILERLASEQHGARSDAGSTCVLADCAVPMVRGVPSALLSTGHACTDACLDQTVEGEEIRLRRLRENPGRGVTDIGADVIEGDAGSEVGDIRLDEIGIRALRASLHACEAGVDRRGEMAGTDQERRGGRLQHLAGIGHANRQPRGRRGTTRPGAESICACYRLSDGGGERAIPHVHRVVSPGARRSATPVSWPDGGPPARRGRRRRGS